MNNIVGKRIKELRMKKNMSVDQLAEKVGKSRATIYRYENGEIENAPYTVLIPFADALGTTPTYLLGWDEEDHINPMEPTSPYDALTQSKPWKDVFGDFIFTDEEIEEIINFAKYIISKRKDKL